LLIQTAHSIVGRQSATIKVESQPAAGTVVRVTLPVQ